MHVCVLSRFCCVRLCDSIDCSQSGSSVYGDFPVKNTEVGCHFPLQRIFLTKGSNLYLLNLLLCRQVIYWWATAKTPRKLHLTQFSSMAQSCPTLCDPMNQHTRPPCPSRTPRVYSNSCPSSQWCHAAISSPVVPFSSCPQSHLASGSFPMSQHFPWGGQSTGVSASASVLPVNTQDWSPLGWTGWISLQSEGLSRVFSNTTVQMHQFFSAQLSSQSNSHIHTWPMEKL